MEKKVKSRVVLCNVDCNWLNCLIRNETDQFGERVTLIDYEYAQNYRRGFDFGFHFCSWVMDLGVAKDHLSGLDHPIQEIRRQYVEAYLIEFAKSSKVKLDSKLDSVDHMMMEIDFYELFFTVFVSVWSFALPSIREPIELLVKFCVS